MRQLSARGIRLRLIALVLIAMSPMFGLTLWTGAQERRQAEEAGRLEARRLARLAAGDLGHIVEGTRQLLEVLASTPVVRSGSPEGRAALFRQLIRQNPQYANLGLYDAEGTLAASAFPVPDVPGALPPLHVARAREERQFAVGEYDISPVTRQPILAFGCPVLDEAGGLLGVVYASLDLGWIGRLTLTAELPAGSTVMLWDEVGVILLRQPDAEGWVGKSGENSEIFRRMLEAGGEGMAEAVGVDGVKRLYAFLPLVGGGVNGAVRLSIGIPVQQVHARAAELQRQNLAIIAAFALLGMLLAATFGERVILRLFGRLLDLANTDALTRAATRRHFFAAAEAELARARRFGHPIGLLMFDLDHFKRVNDTHGHGAGDDVLVEVAARCRGLLRDADLLARYGGEEFAVLLPEADEATAGDVAERLRRAFADQQVPTRAGPIDVTASIGVASTSAGDAQIGGLLEAADRALYQAKQDGRNRVALARVAKLGKGSAGGGGGAPLFTPP